MPPRLAKIKTIGLGRWESNFGDRDLPVEALEQDTDAARRSCTCAVSPVWLQVTGATDNCRPPVKLSVRNDGPGIEDCRLEWIFEPFPQVDVLAARRAGEIDPSYEVPRRSLSDRHRQAAGDPADARLWLTARRPRQTNAGYAGLGGAARAPPIDSSSPRFPGRGLLGLALSACYDRQSPGKLLLNPEKRSTTAVPGEWPCLRRSVCPTTVMP